MWTCGCGTGNYWAGGRTVALVAPVDDLPAGTRPTSKLRSAGLKQAEVLDRSACRADAETRLSKER